MIIELKKQPYEKLIKQLIFLEENSEDIKKALVSDKLFASKSDVQRFFKAYTSKIESIFAHVVIINDSDDFPAVHKKLFPFIVIDSSITLKDKNNNNYYCRLTCDIYENAAGIYHNIYAFSESGINLLLKEKGEMCSVNLGGGFEEYLINSIRLDAYTG